jgi:hypothetical protein
MGGEREERALTPDSRAVKAADGSGWWMLGGGCHGPWAMGGAKNIAWKVVGK